MAKRPEEEEEKQADQNQPPSETILEKEPQRDPDEAVFAEQAIHHYVQFVLEHVEPAIESAMESVASWILSQQKNDVFANPLYLMQAGQLFRDQMAAMMGYAETPLATFLLPLMTQPLDRVDEFTRAEDLMRDLAQAARGALAYVQDNLQSVLATQWDQLRDLAYEGSTEFIPVLHELGLPSVDFDPQTLTAPMIAQAEEYKATLPEQKEEALEQEGDKLDDTKKAEAEEQKQQFMEEEEGKTAVA
jgi:hypothetical protein